MRKSHHPHGAYRSLWSWEASAYAAHLLRLDPMARRRRFHGAVSDAAVADHAARALSSGDMRVIGWFKDGVLRGAVEVALFDGPAGREAEAAFAVELPDRGHGVGHQLMRRAALFARNRGVRTLHVATEAENRAMIALAVSSGAALSQDGVDVDGVVETGERTVFSVGLEALEEEAGLLAWAWRSGAAWLGDRLRGLGGMLGGAPAAAPNGAGAPGDRSAP